MTDGTIAYCIPGCEDQGAVHYAMPVKNLVYNAMQLAHQVTEAAKSHRQKKKAENTKEKGYPAASGEFLGGFYKTDKLVPVLTLVIYWGPEKWDGPLSLREMYTAADETVMRYVPDYKVSLIAPEQITDTEMREFKTSLKEVMLYIKYSKDRDKLQEITKAEAGFRSLDRQAAEVINVTTNSKLKYPEGKETVDVCAAIEETRVESELKGRKEGKIEGRKEGKIEGRKEGKIEGRKEGKIEGKKEGIIEGAVRTYKEFGVSLQETVRQIADRYKLTLQESEEKVAEYWK